MVDGAADGGGEWADAGGLGVKSADITVEFELAATAVAQTMEVGAKAPGAPTQAPSLGQLVFTSMRFTLGQDTARASNKATIKLQAVATPPSPAKRLPDGWPWDRWARGDVESAVADVGAVAGQYKVGVPGLSGLPGIVGASPGIAEGLTAAAHAAARDRAAARLDLLLQLADTASDEVRASNPGGEELLQGMRMALDLLRRGYSLAQIVALPPPDQAKVTACVLALAAIHNYLRGVLSAG